MFVDFLIFIHFHYLKMLLMDMVHDRCSTLLTEFVNALTTILPILFQYCYKYCYSDNRNLWAIMKAGDLALYILIQPTSFVDTCIAIGVLVIKKEGLWSH
jgi:hypothetical protein